MIVAGSRDVEAAEALGRLAADGAVEALTGVLNEADVPQRPRIAQAFPEIPGPAAAAALSDLAEDEDRTVAATAAAIVACIHADPARRDLGLRDTVSRSS